MIASSHATLLEPAPDLYAQLARQKSGQLHEDSGFARKEPQEHWSMTTLARQAGPDRWPSPSPGLAATLRGQLAENVDECQARTCIYRKILSLIDDQRANFPLLKIIGHEGIRSARRKRQERCVWIKRKMTEWPSKKSGPTTRLLCHRMAA